jgi:hypothetical protein
MKVFPLITSEQKKPNPSRFKLSSKEVKLDAVYVKLYVTPFIIKLPVPQLISSPVMFHEYFVVALIEYTFC